MSDVLPLNNGTPLSHPVRHTRKETEAERILAEQGRALGFVVDHDHAMLDAFARIQRYSKTGLFMLIRGETGAGKEPAARAAHAFAWGSKSVPFVATNCAGLNENLVHDEMFGHESGAFTGATKERVGRFEEVAHGGTLLLDEIGDSHPILQTTLLRVLETKKINRIGSHKDVSVAEGKFVGSTNQDLEALMLQQKFNPALFGRISACVVELPPLRDRSELHLRTLIGFLVEHMPSISLKAKIDDTAMQALMAIRWPQNVRQLKHALERCYVEAADENPHAPVISERHVKAATQHSQDFVDDITGRRHASYDDGSLSVDYSNVHIPFMDARLQMDRPLDMVKETLAVLYAREQVRKCNGNQSKASEMLDISRGNLRSLLRKSDTLEGGSLFKDMYKEEK